MDQSNFVEDIATWTHPFTTVTEPITAANFAKANNVKSQDIWYSLTKKEVFDAARPLVFVRPTPGEPKSHVVITSREAIANALQLLTFSPDALPVDPNHLPHGCLCYTRAADAAPRQKLSAGAKIVLFSSQQLPSADSSLTSKRQTKQRSSKRTAAALTKSAILAASEASPQVAMRLFMDEKVVEEMSPPPLPVLMQRSSVERTKSPGGQQHQQQSPDISVIVRSRLRQKHEQLLSGRDELPLHKLTGAARKRKLATASAPDMTSFIEILGSTWHRHVPDVISAVLLPTEQHDMPFATGGGASRVAAFGVEGTLIRTSLLERGPDNFSVAHAAVGENLRRLAAEGCRILLLAAYPSLHHATRFQVEERIGRIANFHRSCCPELELVVVISIVSRFDVQSLYQWPRPELWKYFVDFHNKRVQPSKLLSFFVGRASSGESSGIGGDDGEGVGDVVTSPDEEFALSVGLQFFTAEAFYDGRIPGLLH